MAFGVAAYPNISKQDYQLIQDFRQKYDELYFELARPHFAFVFPLDTVEETEFIQEVREQASGFNRIEFEIKCATVNKDAVIDYYHVLLVPDQGYSDVVKLHDKLYSNLFFPELRLDIDFIPHVGIANSQDKFKVKRWADSWNAADFSIKGSIDKLTIVTYDGHSLKDLKDVPL